MSLTQNPRRKRLLRITTVLYLLLLLTLTHWPHLEPLPDIPGKDKTLHVAAYFVAAGLILPAFLPRRHWVIVSYFVLGLLIFGAADELTQPYFNRTCDICDWLADLTGVLAATLIILKWSVGHKPSSVKR